jgi:hypothetical protein
VTLVLLFFGFCILITSLGFPFETISFDFESENYVLKIVLYVLCSCVSFVYCVIDFGILVFMEHGVSDEHGLTLRQNELVFTGLMLEFNSFLVAASMILYHLLKKLIFRYSTATIECCFLF